MPDSRVCPKCAQAMTQGFIADHTYGAVRVSHWVDGPPEASFWMKTRAPTERSLPVGTFRCVGCGFLESDALPCFALKKQRRSLRLRRSRWFVTSAPAGRGASGCVLRPLTASLRVCRRFRARTSGMVSRQGRHELPGGARSGRHSSRDGACRIAGFRGIILPRPCHTGLVRFSPEFP